MRRAGATGNAAAASTNRRQISNRGCREPVWRAARWGTGQVAVGGGACSGIVACFDPRHQQKAGRLAHERAVRETLHVEAEPLGGRGVIPMLIEGNFSEAEQRLVRRRRREPPVHRQVRVLGALDVTGETRGLAQLQDILRRKAQAPVVESVADRRRERFLEAAAGFQRPPLGIGERELRRRHDRAPRVIGGAADRAAATGLPAAISGSGATASFASGASTGTAAGSDLDRRRGVRRHRRVLDHHRRCRVVARLVDIDVVRAQPLTGHDPRRRLQARPGDLDRTLVHRHRQRIGAAIPARGEARPVTRMW